MGDSLYARDIIIRISKQKSCFAHTNATRCEKISSSMKIENFRAESPSRISIFYTRS